MSEITMSRYKGGYHFIDNAGNMLCTVPNSVGDMISTQLAEANKKVAELEATMKCYECGCGMVEYNGHAIKEIERLEAEAKEVDTALTDACNERDEYATRAEEAEAICQVLADRTNCGACRAFKDCKASGIVDPACTKHLIKWATREVRKEREQVKGAE